MKVFVLLATCLVAVSAFPQYGYEGGDDGGYKARGGYSKEYAAPAKYKYAYVVRDDKTYNFQDKQEERNGNKVSGRYSWVAENGVQYTVTYSDDGYGLKAYVKQEPQKVWSGWKGVQRAYSRPTYAAPAYVAPAYVAPAYEDHDASY